MSEHRAGVTRRLIIAGAASLAIATCWSVAEFTGGRRTPKAAVPDPSLTPLVGGLAPAGEVAYLAVIAHPDDDLYFMNPSVENALRAGAAVTTVVLSAAEGDGRNTADPVKDPAPFDIPGYVRARQNGLRAAYAVMAGLPMNSLWTTTTIDLAGYPAELTTLAGVTGGGAVSLVFLNIADNPWGPANRTPLARLWNGLTATRPTIVPTGGAVRNSVTYTRENLIDVVAAALDRFRPTTVWTTDPDPQRREAGARAGIAEYGDYTDCEDHTAAARFTLAALDRYQDAGDDTGDKGAYQLETFCGYAATRWPESINPALYQEKLRILAVYGWADHHPCADHAGCGDRGVGDTSKSIGWPHRTNRRHSVGAASWLAVQPGAAADHPVAAEAFGVVGGQCVVWTPGQPPAPFGPRGLAPTLARADTAAGATWLAGLRLDNDAEGSRRHQVVVAFRPDPSSDFGPWRALGAPDLGRPGYAQVVGEPRIAVTPAGVLHLVVRNAACGLSACSIAPDGTTGRWRDLGGRHVADSPSVIVGADGVVEVYQAAGKGIARWRLDGSAPVPVDIGGPESAAPVTAVVLPDGRVRVFLRQTTSGRILAVTQRGPGGKFDHRPSACGGDDGYGPIAAVVAGDVTVIAQRLNNGSVGVGQVPHDGGATLWQSGGPLFTGQPAVASLGSDAYVGVVGADSRLALGHIPTDAQPDDPDSVFAMEWV